MVKIGDFEATILVADQPLKEIQHVGKIYVVTEYDTPVSYTVWVEDESPFGEVERQHWPFTPFEVLVTSHQPVQLARADYLCVTIRLDGVEAARKIVPGTERSICFKGIQGSLGDDLDLKQFCFSLPRPVKKLRSGVHDPNDKIASERLQDLGSVVVTIRKATLLHSKEVVRGACAVNFADANKKDCKTAGSTATARYLTSRENARLYQSFTSKFGRG